MFNFVFLCPKCWFQFNSRIVRTQFSSVMILNNWKIIAGTQSYIFRWRSYFRRRRVCLSSLLTVQWWLQDESECLINTLTMFNYMKLTTKKTTTTKGSKQKTNQNNGLPLTGLALAIRFSVRCRCSQGLHKQEQCMFNKPRPAHQISRDVTVSSQCEPKESIRQVSVNEYSPIHTQSRLIEK